MDHLLRRDGLVATLESPGKNRVSRLTRQKSIVPLQFAFPSGITHVNIYGSSFSSTDRLGSEFTGSQFKTFNRLPGDTIILGIGGAIPEDIEFFEQSPHSFSAHTNKVNPINNEFYIAKPNSKDVEVYNSQTLVLDRTIDFTSEFTRLGISNLRFGLEVNPDDGGGFATTHSGDFVTPGNNKYWSYIDGNIDDGLENETRLVEIDIENEILIPTVIILNATKTNYEPEAFERGITNSSDTLIDRTTPHNICNSTNFTLFITSTIINDFRTTPTTITEDKRTIRTNGVVTDIPLAITFVSQSIVFSSITLPTELNSVTETFVFPIFPNINYKDGCAAQNTVSEDSSSNVIANINNRSQQFRQTYIYDDMTNSIKTTLPIALKIFDGGTYGSFLGGTDTPTSQQGISRSIAQGRTSRYCWALNGYYYVTAQNRLTGEISIAYKNLVDGGSDRTYSIDLTPSRDASDNQTSVTTLPIDMNILPLGDSAVVAPVWFTMGLLQPVGASVNVPATLPTNAITSYTLKPNGVRLVHRFTDFFLGNRAANFGTGESHVWPGEQRSTLTGTKFYDSLYALYIGNAFTPPIGIGNRITFLVRNDLNPDENFEGDNIELSIEWVE